jgi:arylsulfatase A-like enzyme/Tfp pilus assembly protein PilF
VPACGRGVPAPAPARPNVLLVTLDTTRADRLGRGFTPTLDRLAAEGLQFTEARTVAPLTLPAHVSMMTGLLPSAHGVRLNGTPRAATGGTMALELRDAGYATRAVVGAFVLDRRFGLDEGFEVYDDRIARHPNATDVLEAERSANEVVDRAIAILDALPSDRPWFLWVHLYDAHAPYRPPAEALARASGDPYNGEIAFVDGELARLFARIDARPDAARTATIAVGDHGESLGEHGEPTHGMLLFEPAIRVPLIIKWPGVAPAERRDPAGVQDVARTVSNMVTRSALPPPGSDAPQRDKAENRDWRLGRDLFHPVPETLEAFSETDYPTLAGWSPVRALVNGRWKLVRASRPALFDLQTDPGEQHDLASAQSDLARSMAARIDEIGRDSAAIAQSSPQAGPPSALPPDTAARLRSLGYVAASQPAPPPPSGAPDPATKMPDWVEFETALAETAAGRPAQALPALARVAAAHPASSLFASTYARALAAAGRKRDALERFRQAVATWPGDWSLYHELAVVARDMGLRDEALRAAQAALTIAPAEPMALNGKGLLLADAGRHAEAAQAFEAATASDPTNAVYLANLGNARRALDDLPGAAQAFRRALDRDPSLADAANGLGVVLIQQGRPADAVPWLEQAARDAGFVEAQLNLGIALQQSGDRTRSAAQYRKVLAAPRQYAREREAARTLLAQVEGR